MPMLEAALYYAERGWHVFPCLAGLKTPATEHGWHDATTDPERIRSLWAPNPNYNVAIATGPSGLFVVDVDPGAEEEWNALVASTPELAQALTLTYSVRTPRGGWHYYFTGEGKSSASKLLKNVDTRGQGGYVLAPPSRVSDSKAQGSYALHTEAEPLPTPALIAERMAAKEAPSGPTLPPEEIVWDAPETITRATAWLAGMVASGDVAIEGSGGDHRTYMTACRLLEMGITPERAFLLLLDHWNPACIPPWSHEELEAKVLSAWRYGQETRGGKAEKPIEKQHEHLLAQAQPLPEQMASAAPSDIPEEYLRFDPKWIRDVRQNLKPLEWLLPNFLPKTGMAYLYGPSGTFKTFVALDLAMSVATGHGPNWWDDGDRDPMPVVFLAGESAHALASQRVDSWLHRHLVPGLEAKARMLFLDQVPPLEMASYWRFIIDRIKAKVRAAGFDRPALLIVDTLSRAMVGWDISSVGDASRASARLETLARELECCVLLVHHTGKTDKQEMVGSYVWYANADTVVQIERESNTSLTVNLHTRKQKESENGPPKRFVGAVYGDSIAFERDWQAIYDEGEKAKVLAGPGSEEWCQPQALVEVLREGPMTTEHLADSLSVRWQVQRKTVIRTLKRLANARYKAWLLTENVWSIPATQPTEIDTSIF